MVSLKGIQYDSDSVPEKPVARTIDIQVSIVAGETVSD
jgi:hypothetical protein